MEDSRPKIYPGYPRTNVYATTYAEISMDNNYCAQKLYDEMAAAEFNVINLPENTYRKFCNCVIISVVFSAMAVEAFINDYGASCIGDDLYYGNFDYLSVLSKLQLIAEFVLKTNIDKSQSYYSHLKTIFSARDKFVHSKSHFLDLENLLASYEMRDGESCEMGLLDKQDVKKDIELSDTAIKAMRDVAIFFDNHDSNAHALSSLMGIYAYPNCQTEVTKFIVKKFNIKKNNS